MSFSHTDLLNYKKFCSKTHQDDVTKMVRGVEIWLNEQEAKPCFIGDAALVLAEALNNVVEHGYLFREDGSITLDILFQKPDLTMQITDQGVVMQSVPKKKAMDGPEQDFDDLPEGGFGWFLIHSLTNSIAYENRDGYNRLELKMAQSG